MTRSVVLSVVLAAACIPRPSTAQRHPDTSLIVSTAWLAAHLDDPSVVVLVAGHDYADFSRSHIPGARFVEYPALTAVVGGIQSELPAADSLGRLLGNLGLSPATHVVVDAPMLPMATRAIMT